MRTTVHLIGAAALFVACEKPGGYFGRTAPKHGPDELWINNSSEPDFIDPGRMSSTTASTIVANLFEGLTRPNSMTLEAEPGVAQRWERSADGRTYTFFLRQNAKWSDGKPVTAHDFVYSWVRAIDPKTLGKYASQLFIIKNAEAFHNGKMKAEQVGVRALGDWTFEVELENPIPYFISLITLMNTTSPVPRWVVEKFDGTNQPERWTLPENIVSNGSYQLKEWHFRHRLVFEKNPHYWDRDNVRTQRIVLAEIENNATALNMYKAGELDYAGEGHSIPLESVELMATKRDHIRAPYFGSYFYWINTAAPPLDSALVRRALNMAIDKRAICQHVTRSGQQPATSVTPPGLAGYQPPPGPPYDPEGAKKLLAKAGYPGGEGFPGFTLIYNTMESHKAIAEAIQQMWKKHLGVEIQIENQEWQVYNKHLTAMDFQMARMGWIGDYPDPYTFLEIFSKDSGNNHSNWKSDEYKQLLDEANKQPDPARRLEMFRKAEEMTIDVMPIIPIYIYTRSSMVKPYVKGWYPNVFDDHPWRTMYIDPQAVP